MRTWRWLLCSCAPGRMRPGVCPVPTSWPWHVGRAMEDEVRFRSLQPVRPHCRERSSQLHQRRAGKRAGLRARGISGIPSRRRIQAVSVPRHSRGRSAYLSRHESSSRGRDDEWNLANRARDQAHQAKIARRPSLGLESPSARSKQDPRRDHRRSCRAPRQQDARELRSSRNCARSSRSCTSQGGAASARCSPCSGTR